jgi:hypothetical protein
MRSPESLSAIGIHNQDLTKSVDRLIKSGSYKDLSTIWVTPTPTGNLHHKVVSSWIALQRPMNQQFVGPLFLTNMEVGDAYNKAVEMILNNPQLAKFKYLLTVEHDNIPPADGLIRLYEGMEKFDGVGGLYWTKGINGQPMIYGDPGVMPRNFIPQVPKIDTLQHCNGLGMGFNLFKIAMFKKMPAPWFRTVQELGKAFSQDLFFYNAAAGYGYRFACDTRIKVGHMDLNTGDVW